MKLSIVALGALAVVLAVAEIPNSNAAPAPKPSPVTVVAPSAPPVEAPESITVIGEVTIVGHVAKKVQRPRQMLCAAPHTIGHGRTPTEVGTVQDCYFAR